MMSATQYERARKAAFGGRYDEARQRYKELSADDSVSPALLANDRGAVAAADGDLSLALSEFRAALEIDPACAAARHNLELISGEPGVGDDRTRIAVVSFLFNWPSTGGGIIHTVELCQFLERAGYAVTLIHPVFEAWGIGHVDDSCPFPTEPVVFGESGWTVEFIQRRMRRAVDEFAPDHVIITDCWNFRPHLARAMSGYSYFLRMQALEGICPLNNLRLLPHAGRFVQCDGSQPADPQRCRKCLQVNAHCSGSLHQAERALSRVDSDDYAAALAEAVHEATAVLVLNHAAAKLWQPHARRVEVVTWGMNPERFPWPQTDHLIRGCDGVTPLLFAGLPGEPIKGFEVLRAACARLWQRRQDFRLVVTADQPEDVDPFCVYVGWQSQTDLPRYFRAADFTLVPTVAQEGLSRTAVEAMACGRPVIGSRIGGLPDIVIDGETGLLAEPGDIDDWCDKISALLDDPARRDELGAAGRNRFEQQYTWESVIQEQYLPLLGNPQRIGRPVP